MEPADFVSVQLAPDEIHLLLEGLDAYEYWQLGDALPRNNGRSSSPTTPTPSATGQRTRHPRSVSSKPSTTSERAERWPSVSATSIAAGDGELSWRGNTGAVYTIHATKKLLDRVKQPAVVAVDEPSTALGNWYATVLFWKPQVALFVNERTLLPVLAPLAPASTLDRRFPAQLGRVLAALGTPPVFVDREVDAMSVASYARTASRSVVGSMNEFAFLAEVSRAGGAGDDLVTLSVDLAGTPCGPLDKGHGFPDREVEVIVAATLRD